MAGSPTPPDKPELSPVQVQTEGNKNANIVAAPDGIPTGKFRAIVIAAGIFWAAHGLAPSPQGLIQMGLTSLPLSEVKIIMATVEFSIAMQYKGIPWDKYDKLSERQLICLEVVTNPVRRGTLHYKLKSVGVSETEYTMWLRNPLFSAMQKELTNAVLTKFTEQLDVALVQGGLDGKLDYIKYIDEKSGRHDPAKKQAIDINQVLMRVVEIIQVQMNAIPDHALKNQILSGIAVGLEALLNPVGASEGLGFAASYRKELKNGNIHE